MMSLERQRSSGAPKLVEGTKSGSTRPESVEEWTNEHVMNWLAETQLLSYVMGYQGEWLHVDGRVLRRLDTRAWLSQPRAHTAADSATHSVESLVRHCKDQPIVYSQTAVSSPAADGGAKQLALAIQALQHSAAPNKPPPSDKADVHEKLARLGASCSVFNAAHKRQALIRRAWAMAFTIAVVTLNALTGAAIFTSVEDSAAGSAAYTSQPETVRTIAAIVSLINAVAVGIRSALGLEESSERHTIAAKSFSNLVVRHRSLHSLQKEPYLVRSGSLSAHWADWYNDYKTAMDQSPLLSDYAYNKARAQYNADAPPDTVEMFTGTVSLLGRFLCCWWAHLNCCGEHATTARPEAPQEPASSQQRVDFARAPSPPDSPPLQEVAVDVLLGRRDVESPAQQQLAGQPEDARGEAPANASLRA